MGLTKNKQGSGNMYEFITLMYSPIRGKCKHECTYCMPSHTKVLMGDFSYQYINKIKKGDKIIGISKEEKGYNKFTITTVEKTSKRKEKTIRITTEDSDIECTLEHPLLGSTKKRGGTDWKKAGSYSPYQILRYIGVSSIINDEFSSRKGGWMAGFCDGDGCFLTIKKNI